jgi:predicted adenylyl cyclase CyaB
MAREIECKIALTEDEFHALYERVCKILLEVKPQVVHKKDQYFGLQKGKKTLFRVRQEGDEYLITRKSKERRADGFEVNEEVEISIEGQYSSIVSFFTSLGYVVTITKEKQGWLWHYSNCTIELLKVSSLGHFIEMEILLDDQANEKEVSQAIQQLEDIKGQLSLSSYSVEPRYYIEMLREMEN